MKETNIKKEKLEVKQFSLTILRHSKKGDDGNLDTVGIKMAKEHEIHIPDGSDVEIYSSDIQRSVDTAKIIGEKFGISKIIINPILSEFPYTDEQIEKLGLSGGKWLLVEDATKLLASKIARFTLEQIENPYRKQQTIAISHVPPIMAFLGHVLAFTKNRDEIDQETKAELIGLFDGFVKPLNGFEIKTDPDDNEIVHLSVVNREFQIPKSFLKQLA